MSLTRKEFELNRDELLNPCTRVYAALPKMLQNLLRQIPGNALQTFRSDSVSVTANWVPYDSEIESGYTAVAIRVLPEWGGPADAPKFIDVKPAVCDTRGGGGRDSDVWRVRVPNTDAFFSLTAATQHPKFRGFIYCRQAVHELQFKQLADSVELAVPDAVRFAV